MDIVNLHFQTRKKDQTRKKERPDKKERKARKAKLQFFFSNLVCLWFLFVCLFVFQCSPNKDKSEGLIDPYSR